MPPRHHRALQHLRTVDPRFGALIERVGACALTRERRGTNFQAVARSIVYQQLSGKAAATIHGRFCALFADGTPTAAPLLRLSDASLRGAGLSGQKTRYLRDLAAQTAAGSVPIETLDALSDEEVIRALTTVKGVGRWTAQMFLMFRLGRPDVLPELDLGVQRGVQRLLGLRRLPPPKRVVTAGVRWAPYRTVASWYLWRLADERVVS
ncbi:MAG: DNA-3-methyladenine glycosylase [Gemmatimonadaceae bacterium]|nr:DNA-3-methyladenine glycosylase [Gemmatimonadaceae bacterium]